MAATIDDQLAELERANAELRRQLDACHIELKEARDQQTATAEVLQVINSSPGDLAPVFEAMLEKAIRLCGGIQGALWTLDGERARLAASHGNTPEFSAVLREREHADLGAPEAVRETMRSGRLLHVPNLIENELYQAGDPVARGAVEHGGVRSLVGVPLVKDGASVGAFMIGRREVRPFTDKQIALLQNFAAQAVIAMENARLITETRQALEQQTATAEVLQVINSSPGDLAPVFDAMLEKALALCGAAFGALFTYDGECFPCTATRGFPPALLEYYREPVRPLPGSAMEQLVRGESASQVIDIRTDALRFPLRRALADLGGARTMIWVALRKEKSLLGCIAIYRQEVRPFADKEIALLQNFAAQAVIAMENARLLTETREALEQQTATAEVLQVINSSPGDLAPVFDAMLDKAVRLCDFAFAALWTYDGTAFHPVALHGMPAAFEAYLREHTPPAFTLLHDSAGPIHFPDVMATEMPQRDPEFARVAQQLGSVRTLLLVPLRKDAGLLGAFVAYRQEVRPFTDKQIALLQNFAAQAVIAMENARLLTETREALEQQTATAEVLQVINSSPGELAPVFDAMLEKALHLCGAPYGILWNYDGEFFEVAAQRGVPKSFLDTMSGPQRPTSPETTRGRLVAGEHVVHITNLGADLLYESGDQHRRALVDAAGARVVIAVSLRKDDKLLGAFTIYRQEARPFSDKQIALVTTFADQAVIAMENARLISETREALEQQTATAEVLQVINSSPGDLAPVFDTMLEKAQRVCGADHAALELYDGERFHAVAVHGASDRFAETLRQGYRAADSPAARALLEGQRFAQIADAAQIDQIAFRTAAEIDGIRTVLFVPLRRDDAFLGMIASARREVRLFSEKEIALLQNFAAQAVIAMENARLLTETREALEQQTATAEVLQVINSSPGDLAPVFDAMLEKAMRLCEAAFGTLWTIEQDRFRPVAHRGVPARYAEHLDAAAVGPAFILPSTSLSGRAFRGESFAQVVDLADEELYRAGDPDRRALVDLGGARTGLAIPLRKDKAVVGVILIYRQEIRPFSDKQIVLLQNFAAQAVIAMENARLITETREALEQQTATAEVLGVINSSPGDLRPVFDAMVERAARLCEADEAALRTFDGELLHLAAVHGSEPEIIERLRQLGPTPAMGLYAPFASGERIAHYGDVRETTIFHEDEVVRARLELRGIRSWLAVALQKDGILLGIINVHRHTVRPFAPKQIALLQNFAAQAVIAMENARLITETREALEQQTATAEVLQVINSSPGDLAPVFDAMLEKAMHLCGAAFGTLWTYDGDRFRPMAYRGVPARYAEFLEHNAPLASAGTGRARILAGERVIHVSDLADEKPYRAGDPHRRALVDLGGARTGLIVPLLKHEEVLGYIRIYRQEVRPFSVKQIALLQNFAAQAVIAMENARLLGETREALEQQTATAEVLQVINSSPGDLAPVFDAMLERATRLCGAAYGHLWTYDGEFLHPFVSRGQRDVAAWFHRAGPRRPSPDEPLGRVLAGEHFVQITDALIEEGYKVVPEIYEQLRLNNIRTILLIPLRKEDVALGVFVVYRQEVRSFTGKQIALLQNFAAQAVIAMENARLLTETREALEQQTATAEVLQVINSSPGDLAPVFNAVLDKATRFCDAAFGTLWTYDGERFNAVALQQVPEAYAGFLSQAPLRPVPFSGLGRVAAGESVAHFVDVAANEAYGGGDPALRALLELGKARSTVAVPLRKDNTVLGAITAYRQEVRPFSDKQIALLQNFAAQAVIAMENARLITETREALEQQTATAEVLQVINSSPGDLAPVFDAMLQKALTLCGAAFGVLWTYDGEHVQAAALRGVPHRFAEFLTRGPHPVGPDNAHGRLLAGEPVVHIADVAEDAAYRSGDPTRRTLVEVGGGRTLLAVPLRRDSRFLGDFVIYRTEVQPFSGKQIALLENFAAQAVIAMENARLITELRQRTGDLEESLEYQTATSDVLKVISQSTFDLGPVLENVIETALRLCRAHMGSIFRLEDGVYRWAVGRGLEPAYQEIEMRTPILAGPGTVVGRAAFEGRAVQIADAMADPLYAVKDEASLARARTMLGVPLLREGAPIGVIAMARDRVEPFSEREVALVTTFADQAVIAIENARLFDELRERTAELGRSVEELKMLGEVGRAVSSTLDLRAVLSTILTASLGMTWATAGAIFRYIRAERAFRLVEAVGWDEALLGSVGDLSIAETETAMSEAALRRTPIQLTDLAELPSTPLRDASLAAGLRSVLIVPLVGPERIFGALVLQRREAGEFPAETVRLMQTLASQSVLAIQNARLFREIADKSEQLALASEHKSQFLANMSHELRTPLNAILGYAELLVDGIYGVLPEKAQGVLERVQNNGKHLLALINDVLDLAKIEAGQLALTLEDYALAEVVRSVVTATEPLAVAKGLKFTAIIQDGMPVAHGDARRVSQVLLNLAGNAIKFTDAGEVEINASAVNGQFLLTVRDTGPGIADADQERIFGEFQQIENTDTRKKGGTGLGLAISKRMVEMQGGLISVDSVLGAGSTFRVVLPIHVEPAMEEAA